VKPPVCEVLALRRQIAIDETQIPTPPKIDWRITVRKLAGCPDRRWNAWPILTGGNDGNSLAL
jgi:hypothetical protein